MGALEAWLGLAGQSVLALATLAGVFITAKRVGRKNGHGPANQMLEAVLMILHDHSDRLGKLETREEAAEHRVQLKDDIVNNDE